ncbi:MAG: FecR family protein [Alphaproteobacteria bacterium]|nr:FecR family protein [Alphaproteobacteria bacterium]MBU1516539.1 FecR family protein [Alphaproteobacteria bacterium]MBU2094296.1 FecR family protein [Alphaproteobacteria bacterium]MBU2154127.1 FecR family protein [Alphaproteobacteria bacterium]MBU2307466.1 FecR family protein [Alphaproteobacteria bacterium]
MNDPRPHSTREQAEAAEWFSRLGHRSVTTQTIRDFQDWRDKPEHDAAYAEVEAFWEANGERAADPEIMRMTEEALARRRGFRLPTWLRSQRMGWSIALATLAIAAGALFTTNQLSPTYSTEPTEQRVIRLADGSRVHLNVGSKVRVQFRGDERRIVLSRGEAFFDVAHDASRPFIVDAGGADVRALGTKFDVRRDDGRVQVTLVEGVVRVNRDADHEAWTLAPNQQLTVARASATKRVLVDAAPATSWTTGRLTFHETPLATAVAEVNRYSDRKIDIEGADLAGRLVSGVFDVGDTDSFVKGVTMLFDLRATTTPDGSIRLSSDQTATGA